MSFRFWGIVVFILIAIGQGCMNSNPEIKSLVNGFDNPTTGPGGSILPGNAPQPGIVQDPIIDRYWWDSDWKLRVQFNVNNLDQNSEFEDMPVLLKLSAGNFDLAKFTGGVGALRIVDSSDESELSFEIAKWDLQSEILIWVKIPKIPASSNENHYYIYYGSEDPQAKLSSLGEVWSSFEHVWHLDEVNSQNRFPDSTASAWNLSQIGNPLSENGVLGKAVNLSGNSDALDTSENLASILGKNSTLAFWMKTAQAGHNTFYLAPGITGVEEDGAGNDIFLGWLDQDGKIGLQVGNGANIKSAAVNDNEWRYYTFTRSSGNGEIRMYINGEPVGTTTSESGDKTTSFSKFGVIRNTNGQDKNFNGSLDEIRVVNEVLSADRIKAEYKYSLGANVGFSNPEEF